MRGCRVGRAVRGPPGRDLVPHISRSQAPLGNAEAEAPLRRQSAAITPTACGNDAKRSFGSCIRKQSLGTRKRNSIAGSDFMPDWRERLQRWAATWDQLSE